MTNVLRSFLFLCVGCAGVLLAAASGYRACRLALADRLHLRASASLLRTWSGVLALVTLGSLSAPVKAQNKCALYAPESAHCIIYAPSASHLEKMIQDGMETTWSLVQLQKALGERLLGVPIPIPEEVPKLLGRGASRALAECVSGVFESLDGQGRTVTKEIIDHAAKRCAGK